MKKAFYYGLISSFASGLVFVICRLILNVLTPPEVLVDFVVRIIPLNLFSLAVSTLGSWAKILLVVGLTLVFIIVGGAFGMLCYWSMKHWRWLGGVRKRWTAIFVGVLLWVLAMVLILPASGKGFFGILIQTGPIILLLVWLLASNVYSFSLMGLLSMPIPTLEQQRTFSASRRAFLKNMAYAGAGLVLAGGIGTAVWRFIVAEQQNMFKKGQMPPEITSNEDFYAVSKDFVDPIVDAESWKLEITGLLDRNLTFNYEQLKALPAISQYLTLECISNEIGGSQIGNAQWKGVRLRDLLSSVSIKRSVRKLALFGMDDYSDSITISQAMGDGVILAYEMNGVPLPVKHGFPVRLLIPGIYGMKNVKWLSKIELVDYDYVGFWEDVGWSNQAVIQTMSRIDVPAQFSHVKPYKPLMLGGIAFAGNRGISRVEISTDKGKTWKPADVGDALSPFTWVLWVYDWTPPANGNYLVEVRATDAQGNLQTSVNRDALPDGATGYDNIYVVVVPNPSPT